MGFFPAVERKIDDDMADFTLQMKVTGKFYGKILNWFVGLDLVSDISQKYVLLLACIEQWDAAEL